MTSVSNIDPDRKLTPKQERFCQLYAADKDFFGNATQAYIEAYQIDVTMPGAYMMARSAASENLTKPHILKRINQLLEDIGFDDVSVDKQLAFLVMQHGDLRAKVAAIKEYNTLKKRTAQRIEFADLRKTRDKIKDFLNEPDDDDPAAGSSEPDQPNAPSAEPAAPAAGVGTDPVA